MKRILIVYHSDTGNTRQMAELIREGCHRVKGVPVDLQPAKNVDMHQAGTSYAGYAFGSPDYFSYVAGELKMFFDKALRNEKFHGKPFVGFGSHGGGAKVLPVIESLAKSCKFVQAADGVMCQGAPDSSECETELMALGETLAKAVAGE